MQGFFEESGNRTGNSYEDLAVYWAFNQNGGEAGIPPKHPKKFPVAMVKLKSFRVNHRILEKPFCQCQWEI